MVVNLSNAAGSRPPPGSGLGLEVDHGSGALFLPVPGSRLSAHPAVDLLFRLGSHLVGDVGVGVRGKGVVGAAQDVREGLGLHAGCQGLGGKSVPQVVEADVRQAHRFQQPLEVIAGAAGPNGAAVFLPGLSDTPAGHLPPASSLPVHLSSPGSHSSAFLSHIASSEASSKT